VALSASGVIPFTFNSSGGGSPRAPKSFLGVDGYDTAEGGGARVQGIAGPNTPFVNAGLIGGDIIKSFDGKPVADGDALRKILAETPPGKTVEVTYIRDNGPGKASLTTMAEKDFRGMSAFDNRPGGEGIIGVSARRLDRVLVPSLNIYGVKVNSVSLNGPADLAGMKEGDIVIKFGDYLIRTPGDLRYRIDEAVPGSIVSVLVVRGGEQLEIPLKIGRSKN
jgi:S1-C subfamily serine protease